MLRRLFSSHSFAIAYLVLAIALLTLNPFQLQAYNPSEWWVLRFWPSDVGENILLFLPLGILLRHCLRLPYGFCLASGFLLSLSIESTQLFIAARTSNLIDLAANSAGTFVGAWLYEIGICKTAITPIESANTTPTNRPSSNFVLAIMLLPLCWVRAMITEWQPHGTWILLPSAIATLAILQASSRHASLNRAQFILFFLAIAPLATQKPLLLLPVAGTSFLVHVLANRTGISNYGFSIGALGIGLGITIHFNSFWMRVLPHHIGEGWYNLHWIEIVLSLLTLITVLAWGKLEQNNAA